MPRCLFIFFVVLFPAAGRVLAQPVLPDVAGASEKGIVLLSWVCQYNGVKAIAVRRSREAGYNYKIIGYVKNLARGQQAFADGHPEPGTNYYKLNVVFNSGLEWSSNYCSVVVDTSVLSKYAGRLPSNDTLQKFLGIDDAAVLQIVRFKQEDVKVKSVQEVSVSFDTKGVIPADLEDEVEATIKRSKITLKIPKEEMRDPTFIRSDYVSVLTASGHVEVKLPGDYRAHVFSLKFYNAQGRARVDIPSLTEQIVIIDKRNFQKRGTYRFVLKKDGAEFESGYVNVSP